MTPVRVAVFGLGAWGESHVGALRGMDGVELVAVCDKDSGRGREIASRYKVNSVYTDFRELLASERLDAVDVVTSEKAHKEIVVEAAERGLQIFVEKPIASNLADADAMIAAAEKNRVALLVGHILRWDTRYAAVKERIASGTVGRIGAIHARRVASRLVAHRYLPYITPLLQLAVHDIDMIHWYTGSHVVECFSRPARTLEYENPDTTLTILTLANGTQASLLNSFSVPQSIPLLTGARMEIYGSDAFIEVDASEQTLFICDEEGVSTPDTTLVPSLRGTVGGGLKNELSYFVSCVSKGETPTIITPGEARAALEVALSCNRSLASGLPERIPRSGDEVS